MVQSVDIESFKNSQCNSLAGIILDAAVDAADIHNDFLMNPTNTATGYSFHISKR